MRFLTKSGCERLAEHRIGLWDVVGSAVRRGSLDQAIRLANHNRIERLVHDFPELVAIAFNGTHVGGHRAEAHRPRYQADPDRPSVFEPRQYPAIR